MAALSYDEAQWQQFTGWLRAQAQPNETTLEVLQRLTAQTTPRRDVLRLFVAIRALGRILGKLA